MNSSKEILNQRVNFLSGKMKTLLDIWWYIEMVVFLFYEWVTGLISNACRVRYVKLGDIYNKVNTLLKMNVPDKYIFVCIHRDQCLLVYNLSAHTSV